MKKRMLCIIAGSMLLWRFVAGTSLAGQVVTDAIRNWAHTAVAQEKALGGAGASENALAVLYFVNDTGSPALDPVQKGLAYMLITDLAKVEGLQVVERAKLQALVEEIGLGKSGLVDSETSPRIGRLLRAAHVVGGKFHKAELEKFGIDPGILNTGAEKTAGLSETKGLLAEIFRMEKEVLFHILEYLKKTPKRAAALAELRKPMTNSLEALIFLFKGFHESDQGNYQMAADFYRRSLKADPELVSAADSLKEIETLGLLGETGHPGTLTTQTKSSGPLAAQTKSSGALATQTESSGPLGIDNWRSTYLAALKKGKVAQLPSGHPREAGLAYTPPEVVTLQEAVSKALENEKGERACDCLKMAVDLEYNPYTVIKTIYEAGGDLEIDQLCMCATEAGVIKAIIAKAVREAVSPLGAPVYAPDEVAQASCFRGEEGLGYTPGDVTLAAIPVDNTGGNNYVSRSAP